MREKYTIEEGSISLKEERVLVQIRMLECERVQCRLESESVSETTFVFQIYYYLIISDSV